MIIIETIIVVGTLCTLPRRKTSEIDIFTDGNPIFNSFQISSGITLEEKLTTELEDLAGIGAVRTSRKGNAFSVNIDVVTFDHTTRRNIYAKERQLYQDFPEYTFDFCLIDMSGAATEHAIAL